MRLKRLGSRLSPVFLLFILTIQSYKLFPHHTYSCVFYIIPISKSLFNFPNVRCRLLFSGHWQ